MALNETHDPKLTSWVASANSANTDFTIQNLPYGAFRKRGSNDAYRIGVAIGDLILDVQAAFAAGVFDGAAKDAAALLQGATLNAFMGAGPAAWSALRLALSHALRSGSSTTANAEAKLNGALVAQAEAELTVPAAIGDYTDFFTSIHHATTVGKLFRPDNPLMPNYKYVPIAYHGRASSINASGHNFPRPMGQINPLPSPSPAANPTQDPVAPIFAASRRLDYELELAVWVGRGNAQGARIGIDAAEQHAFGMCVLNDWSARDIQAWEYQPLGPFLGKSFASTISPWVVTMEALEPYRTAWTRPAGDPQPLAYIDSAGNRARGAIDIAVQAWMQTSKMRSAATPAQRLSQSSFKHAYWTVAQMIAHHTSGGCNLQPGDLLGTGTQSGPTAAEAGSLLELSAGGKQKIAFPNGETRTFIEDGDTVTLRAYCEKPGAARVGFGECAGMVLPVV